LTVIEISTLPPAPRLRRAWTVPVPRRRGTRRGAI